MLDVAQQRYRRAPPVTQRGPDTFQVSPVAGRLLIERVREQGLLVRVVLVEGRPVDGRVIGAVGYRDLVQRPLHPWVSSLVPPRTCITAVRGPAPVLIRTGPHHAPPRRVHDQRPTAALQGR